MSKQTKGYDMANFAHVTPALLATTEGVVLDKKRSRYSVSAIYKAHNGVFKLREPMQTCDSCLVTRATALAKWYEWYIGQTTKQTGTPEDVVLDENGKAKVIAVGGANDINNTVDIIDTLSPEENTEVFNALGLTDNSTTVDYREAIVAFLADPTQAITDERRLQLTNKVAALDVVIRDEAAQATAPKVPIVPAVPKQGVEVLLQQVEKDDYSKTKGDPLYAIYTPSADDANVGTATNKETGKGLAPGTYAGTDTTKVLVVGFGKATYKPVA